MRPKPTTQPAALQPPPHRFRDAALDRLLESPGLSGTAKLIATALARRWAWRGKDHCWPSDASIAAAVAKSVGHARRCLAELEAAGWVRRERSASNRTGRLIRLLWRSGEAAAESEPVRSGALPGRSPARTPPCPVARAESPVVVKPATEPESSTVSERPRPATPKAVDIPDPASRPAGRTAPAPRIGVRCRRSSTVSITGLLEADRALAQSWLASGDPILAAEARRRLAPPPARPALPATLPELLARIRDDPSYPAQAAQALAIELGDARSYAGYLARATEAWRGERQPGELVEALQQASGPRARRRGAVFMHAMKHQRDAQSPV